MKKLLIIMLLAGVSMATTAQTVEKNKMIAQKFYAAFSKGDVNAFDQFIDKNAIDRNLPAGAPNGLEGVKKYIAEFMKAVPDLHLTILDMIGEGDWLAIYSETAGTQKGEFMGMPASNKMFKIKSVDWLKFDKTGKIIEHTGIDDNVAMMQQLGFAPAQPALPEIPLTLSSDGKMMNTSAEQNKMIVKTFCDYYSMGDVDKDLALLSPDFKILWNSEPAEHGVGTYKMLGETYMKAFPGVKWTPTMQIAEGDKVATIAAFDGVQTGPLMSIPASGKRMMTRGMLIDYFKDGKIVKRVHVADDMTMLQQIGAIPSGK